MGVFGLAHLRCAQNFAHPNTPINSPHTGFVGIAPLQTWPFFLGGGGVWFESEVLSKAKMSVKLHPAPAQKNSDNPNKTKKNRSEQTERFS